MIVTDITDMDKKRKKVYLDGEYAFALYNSEIYRYNLEVGEELGEDAYRELDEEIIPKLRVYRRLSLCTVFCGEFL